MRFSYYEGSKFQVSAEVYKPQEDTFLIVENLDLKEGEKVLEIGTGCGIISVLAAEKGGDVVATDISSKALKCARKNSKLQGIKEKIDFRKGDLFEPISTEENFDLIIFNPPYLPVRNKEKIETDLSLAVDGGKDGRMYIDRFLKEFENYLKKDGRVLLVQSSLAGKEETLKKFEEKGFRVKTKEEKFFFENIYLFKAISKG